MANLTRANANNDPDEPSLTPGQKAKMVSIAKLAAAYRTELGELEAQVWQEELEGFNPEYVEWAVRKVINEGGEFMPKLPAFKALVMICPGRLEVICVRQWYELELECCTRKDAVGRMARGLWKTSVSDRDPAWFRENLAKILEAEHERR